MAILESNSQANARLTDLTDLNLPKIWEKETARIINENRMLYEPWVESADSYLDLRERLKSRGFTDIPSAANPMLDFGRGPVPQANTSNCQVKSTMLRKKKA